MMAAGMAAGGESASADPVYGWNYAAADCRASDIILSVGSALGLPNGQGYGTTTYAIRGFCALGYTPGVLSESGGIATFTPPDYVHANPDPGLHPELEHSESVPGYTPAINRSQQFREYLADLQAVEDRVIVDLGSPGYPTAVPYGSPGYGAYIAALENYNAVHNLATKLKAAFDKVNESFAPFTPTKLGANILSSCGWVFWTWYCSPYQQWNGSAQLRNTGTGNWFWMNTWSFYQGGITGNNLTGWATPAWSAAVGNGGVLAGCAHTDTGQATGSADSSVTHQTWHATTNFGCAIGGGSVGGVGLFLTQISAQYKVHFSAD